MTTSNATQTGAQHRRVQTAMPVVTRNKTQEFCTTTVDYLRKRRRWVGLNFRGEEGFTTPGQIFIPHGILTHPAPFMLLQALQRQTDACHTSFESV